MKINRFIFLLAAAATISCGKERVETRGGGEQTGAANAIRFSTKLSRGSVIDSPQLLAEEGGFLVWAIRHDAKWDDAVGGTPLMDAVHVTSPDGGATWTYEEPKDWPEGGYVSFFAQAPWDDGSEMIDRRGKAPRIDYAVHESVAQQHDLLIAAPQYNLTGNGQPVNLQFYHALSRIRFSAILDRATTANEKVQIKSVTLTGLYGLGVVELPYDPTKQVPVKWTLDTSLRSDYTVSIANGGLKGKDSDNNDLFVGTSSTELTTETGYLFMIPQTIQRTANPPAMVVTLLIDGEEATYSAELFSPTAWAAGKSYEYQIVVQADGIKLLMIDSDINLVDWSSAIMIQSAIMSGKHDTDLERYYAVLGNLNDMKWSATANQQTWFKYKCFGVYATNDLNYDITIDMDASETREWDRGVAKDKDGVKQYFAPGDSLIFDFKKVVGKWKTDPDNGNVPYKVTIKFDEGKWTLLPAFQYPVDGSGVTLDAYSGATLPCTQIKGAGDDNTIYTISFGVKNTLVKQGAVILRKK